MVSKYCLFVLFLFVGLCFADEQTEFVAGVDLSHYNKVTNWTQVGENGIKFAIIKATEGHTYVDQTFLDKWANLVKLGIIPGAYHFYRTDYTPEENFENVEKNIFAKVNFTKEHHFAVDYEKNDGHLNDEKAAEQLHQFLLMVEKKYKIKPLIYTYALYWDKTINTKVNDSKYNFGSYRLWIAHYNVLRPHIAKPWTDYYIWQFTSSGTVKGIEGHVDLNWMKAHHQ